MEPDGLTGSPELESPDLWSRLPVQPSIDDARLILGVIASRVAEVRGTPAPSALPERLNTVEAMAIARSIGPVMCTPDLLGAVWEHMMHPSDRRTRGAHFTPRAVAEQVVARAVAEHDRARLEHPPLVWDPAAGGGSFLLAAARHIEAVTSCSRSEIVTNLHASDIDPVAIEVCDATLELWSGTGTRAVMSCCDALLDLDDTWPDNFDLVIGNPPFLGQLALDTMRSDVRRRRLRETYDAVAGGYVDEALLFVELAVSRLRPDGVAALVLPESMLGTRDGEAFRDSVSSRATLRTLWVDEQQSFEAAVDVVAPVFTRNLQERAKTQVVVGAEVRAVVPTPSSKTWAPLLAGALGVPVLPSVDDGVRIGDLARVTAGFRQHFYGISDAVSESTVDRSGTRDGDSDPTVELPLITSGAIDPLRLLWSMRPVTFARTKWRAPVLNIDAIHDDAVRHWFRERGVPKLLLATQSKVIEAVVDSQGTLMPSVPVISLEPKEASDVWMLAAVVSSPFASAWLATRASGTGLSRAAIRVRAAELVLLPTPSEHGAWVEAASAAERAQQASTAGDDAKYVEELFALATAMGVAYGGVDERVTEWWWERLRLPQGFDPGAY